MSEYQYYWFEAIDKPLTPEQQKALRAISTRAEIDSRRFVNEYNYGDFKGKPLEMMKKYFDAHIHYACWATNILMLKVPAKCIDLKLAKQYCTKNTFKIVEHGKDLIFCFNIWVEDGEGWWDENHEAKQMVALRDDILGGDFRSLYLAWLARVRDGNYQEDDDSTPPPVPAGLGKLTEPLKVFAEFMFLNDTDLKEAAKLSNTDIPKPPSAKEMKDWIAALPDKTKNEMLLAILDGSETSQTVHRTLLNHFREDRKKVKQAKTSTICPTKKTCRKKLPKKP
jgi:hypothetical protein